MSEKFNAVAVSIHTTSVCTLRCAKYGNSFPKYKTPLIADIGKVLSTLGKIFEVFDFVRELRFAGAEAFLYPHIIELMKGAEKYSKQFDHGIIVTNGTYIPKPVIIETMKNLAYPLIVRVDNYGPLSPKYEELVSILKVNGMTIDERCYTGEHQAFGGWMDLGDLEDKNYSNEELKNVFDRCQMIESGMYLCDDKLFDCCYAASAMYLGIAQPKPHDFVDFSPSPPPPSFIARAREIIRAWRNREEPFEACKFCNGYDPLNCRRVPAAEQLR